VAFTLGYCPQDGTSDRPGNSPQDSPEIGPGMGPVAVVMSVDASVVVRPGSRFEHETDFT
jgi:hypothetical protein